MPTRKYSQSNVKAAGCPKLFLHRLDAPRTGSQSLLACLGTGLHKFGELYQAHCLSLGVQTDVACARNLAAQCLAGSGLDAIHFDDLLWLAERFAEQEVIDPSKETIFERKMEAGRFYGTPDKVVILDREPVTQYLTAIEINDYKSGWKVPSHADCRADIQLQMYCGLWLAAHPSIRHFVCRYIYLRSGRERKFALTAEQVRAFTSDMEALAYKLDDIKKPTPHAGPMCDYCEIATSCSLVIEGHVRALTSPEQAAKAAEFLCALRGAKRELEARLEPWVAQNGPIVLKGGAVLNFHPSRKNEFNSAEVLTWAARKTKLKAAEIMKFFRIGKTGIGKLAKAANLDAAAKKELNGLKWEVPSSKFGFKKGGLGETDKADAKELSGDQASGRRLERGPAPHIPRTE